MAGVNLLLVPYRDELLPEPLRQPLTYQARNDVSGTAGRIADDDVHGPRRISLRRCTSRQRRKCGSTRGQMHRNRRRGSFIVMAHELEGLAQKRKVLEPRSIYCRIARPSKANARP
jgi:hypothetical protein